MFRSHSLGNQQSIMYFSRHCTVLTNALNWHVSSTPALHCGSWVKAWTIFMISFEISYVQPVARSQNWREKLTTVKKRL